MVDKHHNDEKELFFYNGCKHNNKNWGIRLKDFNGVMLRNDEFEAMSKLEEIFKARIPYIDDADDEFGLYKDRGLKDFHDPEEYWEMVDMLDDAKYDGSDIIQPIKPPNWGSDITRSVKHPAGCRHAHNTATLGDINWGDKLSFSSYNHSVTGLMVIVPVTIKISSNFLHRQTSMLVEGIEFHFVNNPSEEEVFVEDIFEFCNFDSTLKRVVDSKLSEYKMYINSQYDKIAQCLLELRSLKELYLYSMGLKSIPKDVQKLQSLEILSMSMNELRNIPESIGELKSLKQLYLDGNKITRLPDSFSELQSLQILNLQNNKISEISNSLTKLVKLEELNLLGNSIETIPDSLREMVALKSLDLSANPLYQKNQNETLEILKKRGCNIDLTK